MTSLGESKNARRTEKLMHSNTVAHIHCRFIGLTSAQGRRRRRQNSAPGQERALGQRTKNTRRKIRRVSRSRGGGVHLIGEIAAGSSTSRSPSRRQASSTARPWSRRSRCLASPRMAVTGGIMFVEKYAGKWSGSEGDKTLSGIRMQLHDGRTLEGTFAVHAVTWGWRRSSLRVRHWVGGDHKGCLSYPWRPQCQPLPHNSK